MNTKLIEQLKNLERQLFILEMDDFAYCHGNGLTIRELKAQIENIKSQLQA